MRVLQVINDLRTGGAEVLLQDLIAGFGRQGIECELYLLQSTGSRLEKSVAAQGTKIHTSRQASRYSPLHARALARHLRAFPYDIVHVHLFPAQLWAAWAARTGNFAAALVTTEHSTHNGRRHAVYHSLDRWMYAQYRFIGCVSEATREALVQWLPEVAGKARLCPNGIDLERFANQLPARKADLFSLPEECQVILSVGRLEYEKDHETVIRAMSLVEDAHLVLVGTGSMLDKLRRLSQELRIAARAHFLGERDDVPRLLKTADIFVQSSRFEGLGVAALEAMASGLPVNVSRVPGLTELVSEAGLLFEPGNYQQLAAHLKMLLQDGELAQRLVEAGKRRTAAFGIGKTLESYRALYNEALEERKRMTR